MIATDKCKSNTFNKTIKKHTTYIASKGMKISSRTIIYKVIV